MPKRMHPVEKVVRAMDLWGYKTYEQKQRIVARHVKPLLDALEALYTELEPKHRIGCPESCRVSIAADLLAAWKRAPEVKP